MMQRFLAVLALVPGLALAQACPEKNLNYWQAFPAGGESDINLPHIVLQPLEGQVQYRTEDVTPVYWFHYTPDALVVADASPIKTFQDFVTAAKAQPEKLALGGSGLNSANHAAHERLNAAFGLKTTYVPFKGTGDMTTAVIGGHVSGAMSYTAFAVNNKGKVRALAVAMDKRHPLLPDVPTFRELGVDWVDGAFRGIGMPKSSTAEQRKRMSDLWGALNVDPEKCASWRQRAASSWSTSTSSAWTPS
jgi:tripartite-type tricarboxylate transporter receptor subunit TctC